MTRYFIRLSFNGNAYCGWQLQPNGITVQQMVNEAFSTIVRQPVMVYGAGRTDTGVHAKEFYAHLDLDILYAPEELKHLVYKLNKILPNDIAIDDIFPVQPDAHARFSAISRTYEYQINRKKDPFSVNFAWFNNQPLDVCMMNLGSTILLEYSDFACFSKSNTQVKTYKCTIIKAGWEEKGNSLLFSITADRFLRNMVRAIVGTLTELGRGRLTPDEYRSIIESGDRRLAGFSVPAQGLSLTKIVYPKNIYLS